MSYNYSISLQFIFYILAKEDGMVLDIVTE